MNSQPYYLSFTPEVFNGRGPNEAIMLRFLFQLEDPELAATALFWAVLTTHKILVKVILKNEFGVSVINRNRHHDKMNLIYQTSKKCPKGVVEQVMKVSTSLVLYAANKGHSILLKKAFEKGSNTEMKDYNGYTALHWAAWKNDKIATRILLEMGANVGAEDCGHWTPLRYAVELYESSSWKRGQRDQNPPAVIWLLLENEGDRNFTDYTRWRRPLLHLAAAFGHETLIRDLLGKHGKEKPVDVNIRDSYRRTALHAAAVRGDEGVVGLLLIHRADWGVRDIRGDRPIDLAEKGEDAAALLSMLR